MRDPSNSLPLATDRLVLRAYRPADWRAVHRFNTKPAWYRYLPIEPQTPATTKAFIRDCLEDENRSPRRRFILAVTLGQAGTVIGGIRIEIMSLANRTGSLGYTIDPAHWGRGYATEATRRLVAFGFDDLRLNRIEATCHPDNLGSVRVLEKLGMGREGYMRQHLRVRGRWLDGLLYSVLADEFDPLPG